MKRIVFLVILLLLGHQSKAQVGIGNTNPNASLDISASNVATPSNTDGILIPRADEFPAIDPTVNQDGMLLFITGNGTATRGLYEWNNGATSWSTVTGSGPDDDWYVSGTSTTPTNINDNIYTQGNVALGISGINNSRLYVQSDPAVHTYGFRNVYNGTNPGGFSYAIYNQSDIADISRAYSLYNVIGGTNNGTNYGLHNEFQNNGTGVKYGVYNNFDLNAPNGNKYGVFNRVEGATGIFTGFRNEAPGAWTIDGDFTGFQTSFNAGGNGRRYGTYTSISASGTGQKYGTYINIDQGSGGTHYGLYSDTQSATGYASYFIGRSSFGTGNTNRYLMPGTDGTTGQMMTTDGSGNLSFVTPSSGAERIDDLLDGKSDSDGTDDGSSIFLGVNAGATDDSSDNKNIGIGYNALTTNFAGFGNVAIGYNAMPIAFGWDNTAIGINAFDGITSGFQNVALGAHAMPNLTTGSANTIIGYNAGANAANSSGNVFLGNEAGTFASGGNQLYIENSGANADNALIYGEFDNDILRTNSEFQIGNPTGTGFAFPTSDGAAGQVMTTNGAGLISFNTPTSSDFDWFEAGTTNPPDAITDNIFTQGKVGIGGTSALYTLDVDYTGTDLRATTIDYTYSGTSTPASALNITSEGSGVGSNVYGGYFQVANSANSNNTNGLYILNSASAINNKGLSIAAVGSGQSNVGIRSYAINATSNNLAAEFGDPFYPGSGDVVIHDELLINNGSFQLIDGTQNTDYVLRTDAFGNASWVDPVSVFTDTDWTITGANQYSGVTGFVGIGDTTPDYKLDVEYTGTTTSASYVNYTYTGSSGIGSAHDVDAQTTGTGNIAAGYFQVTGSNSAASSIALYGLNSANANFNTGVQGTAFGSGSINYGLLGIASGATTNWAGYFGSGAPGTGNGNVYVNDQLFVADEFRYTDGNEAVDQVLRSDATGIASWVNPASVFTDTDNQTIDNIGLSGDSLGISIEDDGQPIQTVDLSAVSYNVSNFALAKMTMSALQVHPVNTWTKQNFDTTAFDIGSNFNTTTDRFEVTEAGQYRISASYRSILNVSANNLFGISVYVNGAAVRTKITDHYASGVVVRDVKTIESLTVGDYIEIYFFANGALSVTNSTLYTTFEVERIR